MRLLVTGCAGFIGSFVSRNLLQQGHRVLGIDNLNEYYDVNLKIARLKTIQGVSGFEFSKTDISHTQELLQVFNSFKPDRVIHLAAQAGVRYSSVNPYAYADSNLTGFLNILEGCKQNSVQHLIYASTSSVYGMNEKLPFSVTDSVDHPVSLYAATKRANELMAHSYSQMYDLPTTGLRFFTVYGPFGRPDMSLFIFVKNILEGRPIQVFNHGHHKRDFTYVDDIVEGVVRVALGDVPTRSISKLARSPSQSPAPFRIFNIGNQTPIDLNAYIEVIEKKLGKKAQREELPFQPGDIVATQADVTELVQQFGYRPKTTVEEGVSRFVDWYLSFYQAHQAKAV